MMQYNITIESGADFYFPHRLKDDSGNLINLTGATVSAQLREYPEALDAFDFTCSHNGLGGQVILTMPHEATAQIGYTAGFYDVFVEYADETVEKVLWGTVTIQPNVTKPIAGTPMVLLSFASEDDFPRKGIITRMYFSHASSKLYRWNGTAYIGIQQDVTWETLEGKPDTFPPDAHQHDDRYYTEQETDSLLSDKADADSVYTKTEVDTALSSKASIIRTSASGSLVHLTDAAAMPVESLTVGIEPVQSGSGTPSPDNVCPISGWSQIHIYCEEEYDAGATPKATIDLDGTRYGGTVDVRTGVMTVTHEVITPTSLRSGVYAYDNLYWPWVEVSTAGDFIDGLCNKLACSKNLNDLKTKTCFIVRKPSIIFSPEGFGYASESDARTAGLAFLQNGDVQFVYPLAEPITVQLTPAELSLLQGENNVWASTGDVNVGYRADTRLYIDRKIAELQALILDN